MHKLLTHHALNWSDKFIQLIQAKWLIQSDPVIAQSYLIWYRVWSWSPIPRENHGLQNSMMTSSNGNIFRVTGHLCGEFTGLPTQRPVTRSFDILFDLRLNKRLSKQSRSWWFETLSFPLSRQCNAINQNEDDGSDYFRYWGPGNIFPHSMGNHDQTYYNTLVYCFPLPGHSKMNVNPLNWAICV